MKRFFRRGLAVLTAMVFVCILALPGFAYDPNSSGTVNIPEGVTALSNGSIPKSARNIVNVRTVYVPSSVKSIGSGTFTGFINLQNVVIRNDRGAVNVAPGATSGSTRIIYSGAPVHTTTHPVTHTAPANISPGVTRPAGRSGGRNSSTQAAGRWVQALQGQQTTGVQNSQNAAQNAQGVSGQTTPETITYTNEDGEVMVTIPGEADEPQNVTGGSTGMRVVSWVLVGLAIASAGVLVWLKFKKK